MADAAVSTVAEQRRLRRNARPPSRPAWFRPSTVDSDERVDLPDEWGRQSFPASDPPQNW